MIEEMIALGTALIRVLIVQLGHDTVQQILDSEKAAARAVADAAETAKFGPVTP